MLSLSKIGRIPLRGHRPLEGAPKTVTISREADGWDACISCAEVPTQPLPPTGKETGLDVGLQGFLVTAGGEMVEDPRHYRTAEKRLAKAHRRVSRRKKGSKRRGKAVALLKRQHQKVQRHRTDVHHKTALGLLRRYDALSLEDVRIANLVRNQHLAKSISDAGWFQFRTIHQYKAACAGKQVVAVEPAYTSQDCSACGEQGRQKPLRSHAPLSVLWLQRRPRPQRGVEHSPGRAGPSWSGGVGCRAEARIPGVYAWGVSKMRHADRLLVGGERRATCSTRDVSEISARP